MKKRSGVASLIMTVALVLMVAFASPSLASDTKDAAAAGKEVEKVQRDPIAEKRKALFEEALPLSVKQRMP